MKALDTQFMNKNKWTALLEDLSKQDKENRGKPRTTIVENGTILPQKNGNLPWGIGGCLSESGDLVPSSTVIRAFGGKYEYSDSEIEYIDGTVILIPIIPKQWGHFLIDTVSRFWIFSNESSETRNCPILYCAWGEWPNNELSGNYRLFCDYLGISNRMKMVTVPTKAKRIVIPEYTMSFSETYNRAFMDPIKIVTERIMASDVIGSMTPYKKVYLSRTALPTSRMKEIGEESIERLFESNGFAIKRPEKMSLEESVYTFQTAEDIVAMSGTITHNVVFQKEGSHLTILNRTCMPNEPQLMLNELASCNISYVDAYSKVSLRHPSDYGSGPFLLEANENVLNYCAAMGYTSRPKEEGRLNSFIGLTKYYLSLLYYRVTRNKFTISVYYALESLRSRKTKK